MFCKLWNRLAKVSLHKTKKTAQFGEEKWTACTPHSVIEQGMWLTLFDIGGGDPQTDSWFMSVVVHERPKEKVYTFLRTLDENDADVVVEEQLDENNGTDIKDVSYIPGFGPGEVPVVAKLGQDMSWNDYHKELFYVYRLLGCDIKKLCRPMRIEKRFGTKESNDSPSFSILDWVYNEEEDTSWTDFGRCTQLGRCWTAAQMLVSSHLMKAVDVQNSFGTYHLTVSNHRNQCHVDRDRQRFFRMG